VKGFFHSIDLSLRSNAVHMKRAFKVHLDVPRGVYIAAYFMVELHAAMLRVHNHTDQNLRYSLYRLRYEFIFGESHSKTTEDTWSGRKLYVQSTTYI
jgi:hypothetical protein